MVEIFLVLQGSHQMSVPVDLSQSFLALVSSCVVERKGEEGEFGLHDRVAGIEGDCLREELVALGETDDLSVLKAPLPREEI